MNIKRRKFNLGKKKEKREFDKLINQGYQISWENGQTVEVFKTETVRKRQKRR